MKLDREWLAKKWLLVATVLKNLEPKNRLILLSLTLLIVFALIYLLTIVPVKKKNQVLQQQIRTLQNQLIPLTANITVLTQEQTVYEQQKKDIVAQLNADDSFYKLLTTAPPFSPGAFIQSIVYAAQQQKRLIIASLKEEPATTIFTTSLTKGKNMTIYQHNFDLVIMGDYFSLLNYLQQLKQQGWLVLLTNFEFKSMQYPLLQINLQCSVLTLERR